MTDDERDALHAVSELGDGFGTPGHEFPAKEPVFRRISAERQLGRDDEIGAASFRALGEIDDSRDVTCDIADDCVHLRNRNSHGANISSAAMIEVVTSLSKVRPEDWNALAGSDPFLRHEFLHALH